MLLTVFLIAMLAAIVTGILQINTEEIQIMSNNSFTAQAIASAEAGLNDAFAELRIATDWRDGFDDKAFHGGTYDVNVIDPAVTAGSNLTIRSIATTAEGFIAKIEADITMGLAAPYVIQINAIRINQ